MSFSEVERSEGEEKRIRDRRGGNDEVGWKEMAFLSERAAKSPTKEEILRSSERPGGDEVGRREMK